MSDDIDVSSMNFNMEPKSRVGYPLPIEEIAQRLFALLDDCDTADDLAMGNDKLFRNLVRNAHRERFKYATTDGYSVVFNTTTAEGTK